jgi:hypothetical protein
LETLIFRFIGSESTINVIFPAGGSVRKTLLIVTIALLGLLTTTCTPRGIPDALATSACEPPCWQGIIPGDTPSSEVLAMLPTIPFVKVDTIQDWHQSSAAKLDRRVGASGLGFLFDDNLKVKVITLNVKAKFTFAEAIEYYGEPEKVLALARRPANVYYSYFLIYPDIGLAVLSNTGPIRPEKAQSAIRPDDVVDFVNFFDPIYFEQVFSDFSIARIDPDLFKAGLQDWQGFGEVEPIELP